MQGVLQSKSLKTFRWINLLPFNEKIWNRFETEKMIQVEARMNPVSKATYFNPHVGDVAYSLLQDIYRCQYWDLQ